jgi:DNA-binding MarR family transcriptional regulator
VLAALAQTGPTGRGRLAEALGLERTTLTRSAATLERQGWIETLEAVDGRERPLALTPEGRRALDAALPAWKAALDRWDPGTGPRPTTELERRQAA